MPKHAAHATLERERTRSRIVDDEPAPPAALEECLGVLPLGDDDDLATFDLFRPDGVVSAIDVEGLPDEDAVALGCEAQAMAEGLTLVSSTNACGFKGVSYLGLTKDNRFCTRRSKPYQVKIDDRYVGNFATTPLPLSDGSGGRAVLRAGDGRAGRLLRSERQRSLGVVVLDQGDGGGVFDGFFGGVGGVSSVAACAPSGVTPSGTNSGFSVRAMV